MNWVKIKEKSVTLSNEGAIVGALSIEITLSWGRLPGTMNLTLVLMRFSWYFATLGQMTDCRVQ